MSDQLRILNLDPSSDENAVVRCTLSTQSRSKSGSYEALSYFWGTDEPSDSIVVNGCSFAVRETLGHALRHLRLPNEQRHIWVDAICINQETSNDNERNEQVVRMDETYRNFTKVLAWLGRAGDRSTLAMEAIKIRASQFEGQSLVDVTNSHVPLPVKIDGHDIVAYMSAVTGLLSRPWFSRLWVFQEVCLAPQVVLHCGHDVITSIQFANFQLSLTNCPDVQNAVLADTPSILLRQVLQVSQEELAAGDDISEIRKGMCTLLKLLWMTRHRQCQRPEDRYYALRGIALDIDRDMLKPNYSDEMAVTYAKLTLAVMSHSRRLDAMSSCRGPEMPHTNTGGRQRPSWAPDFDHHAIDPDNIIGLGRLTNFIGRDAFFHATRTSAAQPRHSDDYLELTVTGYDIGTIDVSNRVGWLGREIQRARAMVETRTPYIASQTPTEIFWRTLITNRAADSKPATAEVEEAEFNTWWNAYSHPTQDMDAIIRTVNNCNRAYYQHGVHRVTFATSTGWIGLGPGWLQNGDHVCLLAGAQTPFTLRPKDGKYQVVGETYVHRMMDGEYWAQLQDRGERQTDFVLI